MMIHVTKDQSVSNRAFRCTRSHWMTKSPGYACIRQAEHHHATDFSTSASGSKEARFIVTDHETQGVPIHLKTTMTIREAAQYSNIGINKIEAMLKQPNCPFVLYIGTRKLEKRKAFEAFLEERIVIRNMTPLQLVRTKNIHLHRAKMPKDIEIITFLC